MLHIKPIVSSLLRSKSGPVLLFLQMMLSVAIIANASFIISERLEMMQRESGIVEEEAITFRAGTFYSTLSPEVENKHNQEILRNLPNVKAVTSTNMFPLSGGGWNTNLSNKPSSDPEGAKSTPHLAQYMANEHFIEALGLKLVEGRNFYPDEITHSQTGSNSIVKLIVAKKFADEYWEGESAIGKILYQGEEPLEVIGVVEKLQGAWVQSDNIDYSFVMGIDYGSQGANSMYIVRAEPQYIPELKKQITDALIAENSYRVTPEFETVKEARTRSYKGDALMVSMLSIVIVLLLLISALGLSGMVMFNVQRRTKQIGTRRALGARKRDIINQFLIENYLICLSAGLLGGLLALQLGRQLMKHYNLPMLDISYAFATVLGLFIVTTIAVLLPARKAATISPAIATRSV